MTANAILESIKNHATKKGYDEPIQQFLEYYRIDEKRSFNKSSIKV